MQREFTIFILTIILTFLIISCTEEAGDINEYSEDIVYSDSFSPLDWEHPVARRVVASRDKDIGLFIKDDIADPNLRKILVLVNDFFSRFTAGETEQLEELFTDSAYNSFKLRVTDININKSYKLRVEQPSIEVIATGQFWIHFKLLTDVESLVGSFELITIDDEYKISDFENTFFDKVKEIE